MEGSAHQKQKKFKVITIGQSGVGKTTLLDAIQNGEYHPPENFHCGIGAAFSQKVLGSGKIIQMWDTSGQERFRYLSPSYLRNADIVLLVVEISRSSSFKLGLTLIFEESSIPDPPTNLEIASSHGFPKFPEPVLLHQYAAHCNRPVQYILVANKSDLLDTVPPENTLSEEYLRLLAQQNDMMFLHYSAKCDSHLPLLNKIEEALDKCVLQESHDTVKLDVLPRPPQTKSKCY